MITGLDGAMEEERRKRQDRARAAVPCHACGASGEEKHDQDAHREYARAALG